MTLAFGSYDESYPPEVLRGYVAPVLSGGAARRASSTVEPVEPTTPVVDLGPETNSPEGAVLVESTRAEPDGPAVVAVPVDQLVGDEQLVNTGAEFTVTAGTPGTYEPAVSASERPRNVTELRARARPATPAPWDEGAYVLVGTTGKRAHWTGDDWHGDESPGYEPADGDLDAEPEVDEIGAAAAEEAAAEADANGDR